MAVDGGDAAASAEDDEQADEEAGVAIEEMWLAGESADAASLLRLAALRTMGVVAGDDAGQDAGGVARFVCALAEGDDDAAEAVQAALAAAAGASEIG
eukprot:651312-Pleurochrysis_carterae.AAC.1